MVMVSNKSSMSLFVDHCIYLSRDERYQLIGGITTNVIGVSVPVWFCDGKTNEPADEIFCRYTIHNRPDMDNDITIHDDGYEFNLCQIPPGFKFPKDLTSEEWSKMSGDEYRERLNITIPQSALDLADYGDLGSESLRFRRIIVRMTRKVPVNMVHTFLIADRRVLEESLA